jgi:hypothetical protein
MRTPQTLNFVRSHISHSYEHSHLEQLCAQTVTNTHFQQEIRERDRHQTLKNDPSQH